MCVHAGLYQLLPISLFVSMIQARIEKMTDRHASPTVTAIAATVSCSEHLPRRLSYGATESTEGSVRYISAQRVLLVPTVHLYTALRDGEKAACSGCSSLWFVGKSRQSTQGR